MAPFLLLFTTVLVLISVHIMVYECAQTYCVGPECPRTACPSSCSCLGTLVDCSRRGLIEIPKDLPTWVQILDLQNNDISSIKETTFAGLQNLTELDLSHNQLRAINSTVFPHLNSLQKLLINSNYLTELPEIGYRPNLNLLSLSHNEIYSLNSSILENFPKLHVLDLSFNNLVDLPANTFGNSSSLRHLSLSHNRIVSLERGLFDNLTSLEALKLSKNKLSYIPKELFKQLNKLQHLEINSNNLRHIEGLSFQGLVSLTVLKLRHGDITYLQDGAFYGLNGIKKLQLDYNNVSKITKGWLYGLSSLQRLYVNNNNISEIEDDAWDSGKRILELDLSHNKLQSITTKSFDKLYSLKRLILSNNKITYIEEEAFRSLAALQFLELKNNEVSWTIEDTGKIFAGLSRLRFLGLSNNKIKSVVKRAFVGLSRLETLNLTHNEITTIEENAFDDLTHLQELHLNTSSLLCDCNLAWMPMNFRYVVNAKCSFPEKFKGMLVFEIPPSEMICGNSPKPVITKDPRTKITLKGENVTLECRSKIHSSSDVRIHWRKDGKLIYGLRYRIKNVSLRQGNYTLFTSYLNINNIQDENEGHYQCVISNNFGSVYSSKARITVHVFPVFTKTPVDLAIKTGSTARLECGARGQPRPVIAWQKDGGGEDFPAARERRMRVMPNDEVFFILGVTPSDTGVYSCTARNVAGTIVANATLTVLETPSFVKKMEDKETRAGETAVLECMASGSPKPKLTWMKDGDPLFATERHFFTAGNQLLIIVQSQLSDSGVYTCEMSNALGTERGTSHLKISPVIPGDMNNEEPHTTTGVIIIAVVVCVVGTSIIWVIVIYKTRKRAEEFAQATSNSSAPSELGPYHACPAMCSKDLKQSGRNIFLDSHSGHSKDSGTGDSGQPSSDDLLLEDDQGLLIENHTSSKFGGIPIMGSLLGLQGSMNGSQAIGEPYVSSNSTVSKEQVPLLHTFRTNCDAWKHLHKSLEENSPKLNNRSAVRYALSHSGFKKWPSEVAQRSYSAEHLGSGDPLTNRRSSEPPHEVIAHAESDGLERDSGFSTFPRSITLASVSNWSEESPQFHGLPKATPNDSGSFSIAGDEAQHLSQDKCHSVTLLPTHVVASTKGVTGTSNTTLAKS